jgi:enamine deaminase RidA (YjgF/YER057c/UK114 family)
VSPVQLDAVNPESLGAPKGYSNGMLVRGDADWLFVAGQIGWDRERRIVSTAFAAQFEQALHNVAAVIEAAGGKPEHVVRFTMYVTDKREYAGASKDVGAAYRRVMGKHFPAMALVQVADLLEPGAKIEIEATAALPRSP